MLVLHLCFVAWMAAAPFLGDALVLGVYAVLAPALWLHWALNDDTCALTLLECRLRGVSADQSFFSALVSPIYAAPEGLVGALVWAASIALWCVAVARLARLVRGEKDGRPKSAKV